MELLETANQIDLIIWSVIGFIILLVLRYSLHYSGKVNKIYGELSATLLDLNKYFEKAINNDGAISNALVGLNNFPYNNLKSAWENYYKNIKYDDVDYYSLCHPKEFFNREYLLNINLEKRDFIKAIPGLLTSIGLAGTFIAILLGLVGIDPSNMDTINQLVHGLWGKFSSSIAALICAILFVRNERQKYSKLNDACIKLQNTLVDLFPVKSSTEILLELSDKMTNQSMKGMTQMVRKFEEELAGHAGEQFKEIATIATTLSETIKDIQENQSEYKKSMTLLKTTTEKALTKQEEIVSVINNITVNINDEMEKFSNLIISNNSWLEKISNASDNMFLASTQFSEFLPKLENTNITIKELSKDLNKNIETFKNISQNISAENFSPIFVEFENKIKEILNDTQNTIGVIFTEEENFFTNIPETMSKITQEQVHKIEEAMSNYSKATNEFLGNYDKQMTEVTNHFNGTINEIKSAFETAQNGFKDNIVALNSNFDELNTTLKNIKNDIENINGEE